jgi:16S rRNA (guanine966-N2)-methyltransferase
VLDVFAGCGALGIEALSRGAADATFIERSKRAAGVLAENVKRCGFSDRSKILVCEWRAGLRRLRGGGETRSAKGEAVGAVEGGVHFDLALFDPPYDWDRPDLCLEALADEHILADSGLVVIEHRSSKSVRMPEGWSLERVLKVGDSSFSLCTLVAAGWVGHEACGGDV